MINNINLSILLSCVFTLVGCTHKGVSYDSAVHATQAPFMTVEVLDTSIALSISMAQSVLGNDGVLIMGLKCSYKVPSNDGQKWWIASYRKLNNINSWYNIGTLPSFYLISNEQPVFIFSDIEGYLSPSQSWTEVINDIAKKNLEPTNEFTPPKTELDNYVTHEFCDGRLESLISHTPVPALHINPDCQFRDN